MLYNLKKIANGRLLKNIKLSFRIFITQAIMLITKQEIVYAKIIFITIKVQTLINGIQKI